MALKYQELIEEQHLPIDCPPADCKINDEMPAARWVVSPIENDLNFLPNHLYNQKRGASPRPQDSKLKCGFCSLSFHTTLEASVTAFHNLPKNIQTRLGYTHVAEGVISAGWGLVTEVHATSRHFELFENDGCDWLANFQITTQL